MMSLSQTTGYAILALSCLDVEGRCPILAREIARRTGVPLPYLSKVLHILVLAKLVESKRGYRGGFVLRFPAAKITLMDIADAVEGEHWLPACLLGLTLCPNEWACPTRAFWEVERERIRCEMQRVTLAEMAAFERSRELRPTGLPCIPGSCPATPAPVSGKVESWR